MVMLAMLFIAEQRAAHQPGLALLTPRDSVRSATISMYAQIAFIASLFQGAISQFRASHIYHVQPRHSQGNPRVNSLVGSEHRPPQ
jgi:hypothetical protein